MKQGILVLGHGSRVEGAEAFLEGITDRLRQKGGFAWIRCAYLKFNRPTMAEGIAQLAAAGAEEIILVPAFLFQGSHTREEIPEELAAVRGVYPGIRFRLAAPIGADDRIADILLDRINQVKCEGW